MNYYYPEKYNYLYKNYFKLRRYLPHNPFAINRKYNEVGMSMSWLQTIILSFYHLPIRFMSLLGLIKENKRLERSNER